MQTSKLKKFLRGKEVEATKQKEEKRKKPEPEEHEGMPPRQHFLMKCVAEIGTQSAMKSGTKTLHEFTSHIPPKHK
jgi:hypothetical protein